VAVSFRFLRGTGESEVDGFDELVVELLGASLLAEIINWSESKSERTKEVSLSSSVILVDEGGIIVIKSCIGLQNLKILYVITFKP
jgi:hypothetical protein